MKVFIAGATGVLGRRLIRQFTDRGHTAIGLARSEGNQRAIESLGGESQRGSLFNTDSLAFAAEGADVIIHAATSIPTKTRVTAADWEMNDRIRRDGTRALSECATRVGAKLYIQQSVTSAARPKDGSYFNEDSPIVPDPVVNSAIDSEYIAREAGEKAGFGVSVLRCGWFYSHDSSHTKAFGEGLVKRRMPIIGKGDAVMANLQVDDAASAFVTAAENAQSGTWHIVDDEPMTVAEYLNKFAELLDAPTPRRVPAWLARIIAGKHAVEFMTSSTRTSNARFKETFGWSPQYPSYRDGLHQIVSEWKAKGFVKGRKEASIV